MSISDDMHASKDVRHAALSPGTEAATERWCVGPWTVDVATNTIVGLAGPTQVEPRVMDVLQVFIQRPGETLDVDYLLEAVWGDTVVEENALRRAISQLRKAFDDDARQPAIIQTVPKKGYRLIAPVVPDYEGDSYPATAADLALAAPASVSDAPASTSSYHLGVLLLIAVVVAGGILLVGHGRWSRSTVAPMKNVPVTSLRGVEADPVMAPDGSTVAFVWLGDADEPPKVYLKLVGADAPRRLTEDEGAESSPVWSPDGRRIAYLRRDGQTCGLYMAPVAGRGVHKLADCGGRVANDLAWSPDGAWLAFPARASTEEPLSITLLSPETLERRPLTTPAQGQMDTDPVFAPDGERLSFVRYEASGREGLYIVSLAGGAPEQILVDFGNLADHDWTPDGQHLVFSSNQGGNYRLWRLPVEGGAPTWMAEVGAYDPSTPSFARKGARMAYVEWFFDFNIWRVSTSGHEPPERVIASSRWDLHPQFSPDGERIAFTSNRSGHNELWEAQRDGSHPKRLTGFGGGFVNTPRWSPDGRKIVFEVRHAATPDLYVIGAEGGVPHRLTDSTSSDVAPSWSPDGKWIYFGSTRSGRWQVWKIPSTGGVARQVTDAGGFAALASDDGHDLYYTKADSSGVWRRPVKGGPEVQVMTELATGDWGNWALDPEGIYFVRRTRTGPEVAFFAFSSGATRTVVSLDAPIAWNKAGLSLSPDGTELLVTQTDHHESNVRLVEPSQ